MREILSIQCGNTANYIGTHFWNFQDPTSDAQGDIDHDVLFSAGQARNGTPTYTPRLLIYDRARHFGSMKRINALFAEPETAVNGAEVVQQKRIEDHPYQSSLEETGEGDARLLSDDNVRFWSDYNTQFYRPETYLPISTFSETSDFKDYDVGIDTYCTRNQQLDVFDSDVRPFLEECDALSLVTVSSSLVNAWGGYTTELMLDLASELPKTSRILFSTEPGTSRVEHVALGSTILALHDEVDAIVPFDASASWHGSARAANWVESFTLPFRTKEHHLSFSDVSSFMVPDHKIFVPRLNGAAVGPIDAIAERSFRVSRGQKDIDLQSRLIGGKLVTTYTHSSSPVYPTSFPDSAKLDNVVASLDDSAIGTTKYIAQIRQMISGIRGAKGYTDRKEQVEELLELEGRYRHELMESEASSDDDGF